MNHGTGLFLAPFAIVVALSLPAAAQSVKDVNAQIEKLLGDADGFASEFKILQANIGDGARMAGEVEEYPITITVDGKDVSFASAADFVAGYDALVTPKVIAAVKQQNYKDLLVTAKGVMFGRGELWMNAYCLDGENCDGISWEISAINR